MLLHYKVKILSFKLQEEDRQAAFQGWLRANDVEYEQLYFKTYGSDYRGVHIRETCKADDVLLKVPLRCMITVGCAKHSEICQKLIQAGKSWMVVVIVL